jgi:hypothetical protein
MSYVSVQVLAQLGLAMLEGGGKYGAHNYREAGVRASVYYDALWRHMGAYWEGQDVDPDSGLHHVAKAMGCLHVLLDSILQGNCEDDRPIRVTNVAWLEEANIAAKDIIAKHKDHWKPRCTEKARFEREAEEMSKRLAASEPRSALGCQHACSDLDGNCYSCGKRKWCACADTPMESYLPDGQCRICGGMGSHG